MIKNFKMKKFIKFAFVLIIVFQFVDTARFAIAACSMIPGQEGGHCTDAILETPEACNARAGCQWSNLGEPTGVCTCTDDNDGAKTTASGAYASDCGASSCDACASGGEGTWTPPNCTWQAEY